MHAAWSSKRANWAATKASDQPCRDTQRLGRRPGGVASGPRSPVRQPYGRSVTRLALAPASALADALTPRPGLPESGTAATGGVACPADGKPNLPTHARPTPPCPFSLAPTPPPQSRPPKPLPNPPRRRARRSNHYGLGVSCRLLRGRRARFTNSQNPNTYEFSEAQVFNDVRTCPPHSTISSRVYEKHAGPVPREDSPSRMTPEPQQPVMVVPTPRSPKGTRSKSARIRESMTWSVALRC